MAAPMTTKHNRPVTADPAWDVVLLPKCNHHLIGFTEAAFLQPLFFSALRNFSFAAIFALRIFV